MHPGGSPWEPGVSGATHQAQKNGGTTAARDWMKIGLASAAAAALASSSIWLLTRHGGRDGLAGAIDAIAQDAA